MKEKTDKRYTIFFLKRIERKFQKIIISGYNVENGLKNAEKDADSRNELQQWINLVQQVKYKRSVNKKLIKKIDKYFSE